MSHTKPVREGDTRRCPECGGFQVLVPVGSDRADMTMHLTEWRCINSPLGHRAPGPLTNSTKPNKLKDSSVSNEQPQSDETFIRQLHEGVRAMHDVMPRCSTCKHWIRPYFSTDTGICELATFKTNIENPAPSDAWVAEDPGHLRCGRDFGCVNHESKETT